MQALRSAPCAFARLCPDAVCVVRASACAAAVDAPLAIVGPSSTAAAPSWAQLQHAAQRYTCTTPAARAAESASPERVQQSVFQDQSRATESASPDSVQQSVFPDQTRQAVAEAVASGPEADNAGASPSGEGGDQEQLLKDQLLEAALKHVVRR